MSTPLETIQPIPQGARITEQAFRDYITDPANFNDLELADRVALVAAAVSALPVTTRAASIPATARVGDWFVDTTANNQLHICVTAYTSGGVLATNWRAISDATAQAAATAAAATAGTATQTVLSDTMPDPANAGWIWVKTGGRLNYTYACRVSYELGAGIPPGGIGSQWELVNDTSAALLAATAQGLNDGKTNTFVQSSVPAAADARDMWVDIDDNSNWVSLRSYLGTDGAAYNSSGFWDVTLDPPAYRPYAIGQYVSVGNDYYIANVQTLGHTPPHGDWTLYGTYASLTLFRESQWIATADVVAQALVNALATVTRGSSTIYYGNAIPNPDLGNFIYVNDIWVDTASDIAHLCILKYGHDAGSTANFSVMQSTAEVQALITETQGLLDGKKAIYYQAAIPPAADQHDLWCDSDNENRMFINSGLAYVATDGAAWSAGSFALADIRLYSGIYWRSNTDANTSTPGADANWSNVGSKTTAAYSSGTTYLAGQLATSGGKVWRSRKSDNLNNGTPAAGEWWEEAASGVSDIDIFRAEMWNWTSDQRARQIAIDAGTLADGKSVSYYQPELPAQADVGDLWTDTNNPHTPGGTDYLQYRCKTAYTTGGSLSNWEVYTDPVALALAQSANAVIDHKRTTFTTAVAEPVTKWPGSGSNAGQIQIIYWSSLPIGEGTEAGYIARKGDLWINYTGTEPNRVPNIRICVQGYAGDATDDPGSLANWKPYSDDGLIATTYLKLAGGAMSGLIDFTATAATQVFKGKNITLTEDAGVGRDLTVTRDASVTRDLTVTGNLTVHGTQTIVDSTTIAIGDSQMKMAKDNAANITDIGTYGPYVASGTKFAGVTYKAADKSFLLYNELTTEPTTSVDAGANPAPVKMGKLTIDSDHATDAIDLGGKIGMNSGAPSANTDLDTVGARNAAISTAVSTGMPIGSVVATLLAAAPDNWALCQGQTVSKTGTYAALWSAMGSAHLFAADPGGGNFVLPDLRARVPVGKSSEVETQTVGQYGGTKTHTLSESEIPSHTHGSSGDHGHTVTDANHNHTTGVADTPFMVGGSGGTAFGQWSGGGSGTAVSTTGNSTTGVTVPSGSGAHQHSSVGSGAAHNNLQPYLVLNYMIKIA